MTDSGRPEPVAWCCRYCKRDIPKDEHCSCTVADWPMDVDNEPLYPPSVVAGELREVADGLHASARRQAKWANDEASAVLQVHGDRAARRAEKWEAK